MTQTTHNFSTSSIPIASGGFSTPGNFLTCSAVKKGSRLALALARIARGKWGPEFKHMRRLFTAVIAPRMDYATAIWHRPEDHRKAPTTWQINKLSSVQRQAMKTILGCFRTTPTIALEIETALLPTQLRLRCKALQSISRIQTYPEKHPLRKWVRRALLNVVKLDGDIPHASNLEQLALTFPEHYFINLEQIEPYIRPPWWNAPIQIHIDSTKKEAAKNHQQMLEKALTEPDTICIYTDGSGINGKIGAAAYSPTVEQTRCKHMGDDTMHNVFAAEVEAIEMASEMIEEEETNQSYTRCIIFEDSQAAITAIEKPKRQSGQEVIKRTLDNLESIKSQRPELTLQLIWIPGHKGIEGNEKADQEAKQAAEEHQNLERNSTNDHQRPRAMKAARNAVMKKYIKQQWIETWLTGNENARKLRNIYNRPNTMDGAKLYETLTKRQHVVWIAQLRTAHCPLNDYFYRF